MIESPEGTFEAGSSAAEVANSANGSGEPTSRVSGALSNVQ